MTWQLAVSTGCCLEVPVLSMLDVFERAGVSAVEVSTPPRHFDPAQPDQVSALAARLRESRIVPVSMHAPFGNLLDLSDPSQHDRQAAIGATLTAASALRDIGGSRIVVHVTDVVRNGHNVGERLGHCVEALRVVAKACAQMGVTLLVETPLPHLIGGAPDEFAWVVRHLDLDVGVCLDTGHAALGRHWDRFMTLVGDRLVHLHVNDTRGQFDDHLPPGDGVIDWRHIRATLEQAAFGGWIVLELSCSAPPGPGDIARIMASTRHLFGRG